MDMSEQEIVAAAEVCEALMEFSREHEDRFLAVCAHVVPYGDAAYGRALAHWRIAGSPKASFFSYAEDEDPCPALLEFRAELTERFGLPILTVDEAEKRKSDFVKEVRDWGTN